MKFKIKKTREEIEKMYYAKHKEKVLERSRKYQIDIKFNRSSFKLWSSTKRRAKQKNLEFNITVDDLTVPESCPILGIPLFFTVGKKTDNTPSVGRVDNTKGYIKGNVKIISQKANTLKSDVYLETAKKIVEYIESNLLKE